MSVKLDGDKNHAIEDFDYLNGTLVTACGQIAPFREAFLRKIDCPVCMKQLEILENA